MGKKDCSGAHTSKKTGAGSKLVPRGGISPCLKKVVGQGSERVTGAGITSPKQKFVKFWEGSELQKSPRGPSWSQEVG